MKVNMIFNGVWKVYLHTNLINNKKYVGITSQSLASRWGHNGHNYKRQKKFYNAIQKYSWENFSHELLYNTHIQVLDSSLTVT